MSATNIHKVANLLDTSNYKYTYLQFYQVGGVP